MKLLGNIVWFIFAGLWQFLGWLIVGCLWCITIIGIPVGLQCFKFAKLALWPFGKEIIISQKMPKLLLNIVWLIFGGVELAIAAAINGAILCITIIGIPFGMQCFKMAKLALLPFGAEIK